MLSDLASGEKKKWKEKINNREKVLPSAVRGEQMTGFFQLPRRAK